MSYFSRRRRLPSSLIPVCPDRVGKSPSAVFRFCAMPIYLRSPEGLIRKTYSRAIACISPCPRMGLSIHRGIDGASNPSATYPDDHQLQRIVLSFARFAISVCAASSAAFRYAVIGRSRAGHHHLDRPGFVIVAATPASASRSDRKAPQHGDSCKRSLPSSSAPHSA